MKPLNQKERRKAWVRAIFFSLLPLLLVTCGGKLYKGVEKDINSKKDNTCIDTQNFQKMENEISYLLGKSIDSIEALFKERKVNIEDYGKAKDDETKATYKDKISKNDEEIKSVMNEIVEKSKSSIFSKSIGFYTEKVKALISLGDECRKSELPKSQDCSELENKISELESKKSEFESEKIKLNNEVHQYKQKVQSRLNNLSHNVKTQANNVMLFQYRRGQPKDKKAAEKTKRQDVKDELKNLADKINNALKN